MNKKNSVLLFPMLGIIAFLLLGISMILWPNAIAAIIMPLIGTVLLIVGIQITAHTIAMSRKMMDPEIKLIQGLVNMAAGLVFLLKRDLSAVFVGIIIGLYVLVTAVVGIAQAFGSLRNKKPFAMDLAEGVLQLVLGMLIIFSPFSDQNLWVRLLGVNFVISAAGALRFLMEFKKVSDDFFDDEA